MSKIEWTDETWNPVTGCSKVSEGCRNCYAERLFPRVYGRERKFTDVLCHEDRLDKPLHWRKPRRCFVNSMSDLFHPDVPNLFIARVFNVMWEAQAHTFQILTKRPERMQQFVTKYGASFASGDVPHNVWLGVSVENQKTADERIPILLDTPAAVRFLSCEPLLGPIDLMYPKTIWPDGPETCCDGSDCACMGLPTDPPLICGGSCDSWINQVIVGGESGPKARPMHPEWARSLRNQCVEAGVAFFFKQWGEWHPPREDDRYSTIHGRAGKPPAFLVNRKSGTVHCTYDASGPDAVPMLRLGKKAAGRLLDGREWNEEPCEKAAL